MNRVFRFFAKVLGMFVLFIAAFFISLAIICMPGFSFIGEANLGKDLQLIDFIFTRRGVFRIISIKSLPDFPLPNNVTMDPVTRKTRQNVVSVQRDNRYVAFKTIDMQTGEKNFYILDKSFANSDKSKEMTTDRLRELYLFSSPDSTEFVSHCHSLGMPILLK